jgi:hypothetical protein
VNLLCFLCHNEIPSAAVHVTTEHGVVLCDGCGAEGHSQMYPLCDIAPHGIEGHPVVIGTSLSAYRELMRMRRVREAAG